MKVVLDPNVLVRATKYATGPARELLGLLQADPHVLVISREILVELVLSAPLPDPSIDARGTTRVCDGRRSIG